MSVTITQDMLNEGKRVATDEVETFLNSARDDAAWQWFLTTVYTAMRELEPVREPEKWGGHPPPGALA